MGKVMAVCTSKRKGTSKKKVPEAILRKEHGLAGDAHAGPGNRQVSLLAEESLEGIRKKGLKIGCGGFAENLTTSGIELTSILVGTRLLVGGNVVLEVTQIGKECKKPCKIFKTVGECILPGEGIFGKVVRGGKVKPGDSLNMERDASFLSGILTTSDRRARGKETDESFPLMRKFVETIKGCVVRYKVVPDELSLISSTLGKWADEENLELILTTGGTGLSPRDVTPEATKAVLDRDAPGISELLRAEGGKRTEYSYLSRGVCGIRKKTLIINLPGSPKGVEESLDAIRNILPHAIEILQGKHVH